MAAEFDAAPKLAAYAHPERLVTTEWLAAHLGEPGLVVVESDEDVLLYETGHIPGAVANRCTMPSTTSTKMNTGDWHSTTRWNKSGWSA